MLVAMLGPKAGVASSGLHNVEPNQLHTYYGLAWPCGLMDKALVFGTKDCRFDSCQGHLSIGWLAVTAIGSPTMKGRLRNRTLVPNVDRFAER